MKSITQKEWVKSWAKMELNSSYGYPPVPVISTCYDENMRLQITEEGRKRIKMIEDLLNKYE